MSPGLVGDWLSQGVAGLLLAAVGALACVIRFIWHRWQKDLERFDTKMADRDATIRALLDESRAQMTSVLRANTEAFQQSREDFSDLVAEIAKLIEAIRDQEAVQQRQDEILKALRALAPIV